ncbi:MAG: tetratricopeptide repeat protein [Pirellulaceae bacterium]
MARFELTVNSEPSGFVALWFCDGAPLGESIAISPAQFAELEGLTKELDEAIAAKQYFQNPGTLKSWGQLLFDTFWRPVWPLPPASGAKRLLIRASDVFFFNLPWELIFLPGGLELPLGCDADWSILRVPQGVESKSEPPDPGPLRLLMMVSAPIDQHQLRYEEEEDALLKATATLSRKVVVLPLGETGSILELGQLVSQHRPHVVHLTGHGELDTNGNGRFAFESERGGTDSQPVEEMINQVFRGSAVRCLFLNACQTGKAAAAGLSEQLVKAGVPLVLGWGLPVVDDTATEFAAILYSELAAGKHVPAAMAKAREAVWRQHRHRMQDHELWDLTFALARLYGNGDDVDLVDAKAPLREYKGPQTRYMLLGDEIKGLKEGFIGRRREQQQLIPALRDGDVTFAVLTGIGGAGKSTLATRAVNKLQAAGFAIYAVKVRAADTPDRAGQNFLVEKLLPILAEPFMVPQRQLYETLMDGKLPMVQRIHLALREWCKHSFVLVLDNFEDALELETRSIANPELRAIYEILARDLTAGSRVLVTCRYRPEETPLDQPQVLVVPLNDIQEADFRKYLRQDEKIDAHLRAGRLTEPLLKALFRTFGGTPGCWFQLRPLLHQADLDDWDGELPEETLLEEKRQEYCERLLLPKLYDLLPESSKQLVSRLGISELPISLEALASLIDTDQAKAAGAIDRGVAYGLAQRFSEKDKPDLFHVPGLIRHWLIEPTRLTSEAARTTHEKLARFWRAAYEADQADELRVSFLAELFTCFHHAHRAEDADCWNWTAVRLSSHFLRKSDWKAARLLLEAIPEALRDSTTWHQLASIDLNEGNYAAARETFGKSLHIKQEIGDRAGEAATWHQLATIDVYEGNYAAARESFGKSLQMELEIGDRAGEAATRHNLATIDMNEGNYAAARESFGKSLQMRLEIGDRAGEATTRHQLATIDMKEGNYAAARESFGKVLQMELEIGDRAGEAYARHNLATIDLNEGNYAAARESFGKALQMQQEIGNRTGEAATWAQLGFIASKIGKKRQAFQLNVVSFDILSGIGSDDVKQVLNNGAAMMAELDLTDEQLKEMMQSALASYQADGGAALIHEAFGTET